MLEFAGPRASGALKLHAPSSLVIGAWPIHGFGLASSSGSGAKSGTSESGFNAWTLGAIIGTG